MSAIWKIIFAILLFFIALGTCGTAFETWVMNSTTSTVMFPDGQHSWWDPRSTPQLQPNAPGSAPSAEATPPDPAPDSDINQEDHQAGNA